MHGIVSENWVTADLKIITENWVIVDPEFITENWVMTDVWNHQWYYVTADLEIVSKN
jgi:hypothetical protein